MFIDPYYGIYNNYLYPNVLKSYIRFLHASPDTLSTSIYTDNEIVVHDLEYKRFTKYVPIQAGKHKIKITPKGKKIKPIINARITIPAQRILTVAIFSKYSEPELRLLSEPLVPILSDKAMLRFIHLSPQSSNFDITLPNGTELFSNVAYGKITDYKEIQPDLYHVEVRSAGSDRTLLYEPNISLKSKCIYSLYVLDSADKNLELQSLISLDGNSYIQF